jgi:predicted  nucleic acid-binding Zn-ribbon protein
MTRMQFASESRVAILRRIAQLETELRRVRAELKNLRSHDPATSEVVIRGAKLSRERSALERRLETLRMDPTQAVSQSQ